jgi:tRNA(Ile)-lysidine synthase
VPVGDQPESLPKSLPKTLADGPKADAILFNLAQAAYGPVPPARLGLAVSGGSDSMAMLHILARAGWQVQAATVDHRLRPEAAEEAAFVANVCNGLGVPHATLVWEHDTVSGNLMQAARQARYRLLADWAKAHRTPQVALAHTADDQAETFLMGLSRAAGLDGLSGMRTEFNQDGVTFLRPFLQASRADLRGFLQRHGLAWVDDPTNDDETYTRTRARRALQRLKPLGITVDRLAKVIQNLAMAQGALSDAVNRAGRDSVHQVAGALTFQRQNFLAHGPEIDRLMLQAMLGWMAGLDHAPRADSIRNLHQAISLGRDATLAGCRFRHRKDSYTMTREQRAVGGPVLPDALWDGRWQVTGPAPSGAQVRALGADGLRALPDWRKTGLPREVLMVTPAVWQGETLIAAPLVAPKPGWTARLASGRSLFGLSH